MEAWWTIAGSAVEMGFKLLREINTHSRATGLAFHLHQLIALHCDDDTRRTLRPVSTPQLMSETRQKSNSHLYEALAVLRALEHVDSNRTGTVRGMNNFHCRSLLISPGGTTEAKITKSPTPPAELLTPSAGPFLLNKDKEKRESALLIHPTGIKEPIKKEGPEQIIHSTPNEKRGHTPEQTTPPVAPAPPSAWYRDLTEAAWMVELTQRHPHLDIEAQLDSLKAYCSKKAKTYTRGFAVNCLSKAEKPEPVTVDSIRRDFDRACKAHHSYCEAETERQRRDFAVAEAAQNLPGALGLLERAQKEQWKKSAL